MSAPLRPPALVLQLAAARGQDPGAALGRRVEQALETISRELRRAAQDGGMFTHDGGRRAARCLAAQERLLAARAMLLESTGESALPAPRRPETIAAIHEQVREILAAADRVVSPKAGVSSLSR